VSRHIPSAGVLSKTDGPGSKEGERVSCQKEGGDVLWGEEKSLGKEKRWGGRNTNPEGSGLGKYKEKSKKVKTRRKGPKSLDGKPKRENRG